MEEQENFDLKHYILAAKELGYPDAVIEDLKKCKNHIQASNVMKGARYGEYRNTVIK